MEAAEILKKGGISISEGLFTPEEVIRAERDPMWLVENEKLSIKIKSAKLIPFKLNTIQKKIVKVIRELQAQNKPIRIYILKARQMGCSTLIEAIIYAYTSQRQNINSCILADDLDGSNYLFDMSKLYHEQIGAKYQYPLQKSNEKKIEFANRHSQILVKTADNLEAGRKYTFQFLHLSEVCYWRNAEELMLGLNQAVPELPNTMAIAETTANGFGDYFCKQWKLAKEGKTDWYPLFLPWFDMEEYSMPVAEGWKINDTEQMVIGDNEQIIIDKYNLSLEQMVWRRWYIINKCGGSLDKFMQEYPSCDEEAFLVSGHCRFNTNCLKTIRNTTVNEGERYILKEVYGTTTILQNPTGWLRVWKKPERNQQFIIGVDVAEGIEKESEGDKEHDYSTAEVLNLETLEQVAEIRCHLEPDIFAEELKRLGTFYSMFLPHNTMIGVEVNNHGFAVLQELKKIYKNLYYMETFEESTQTRKKKLGWLTNAKTKPLMVAEGDRIIREGLSVIHSPELLSELMTFVRLSDGKTEAQQGCFDDLVIAYLIALQMIKYAPRKATVKETKQQEITNREQDEQMSTIRGY